jgi:hypothetical protein
MSDVKDDVAKVFDAKATKTSCKMGAEEMRENLKAQHPNKFRLASTNDIRNEISSLVQKKNKDKDKKSSRKQEAFPKKLGAKLEKW